MARDAGALLRERFGSPGDVRDKGYVDPSGRGFDVVTEVDYLSERLVLDAIAALDGDAVVLAEEGGLVYADGRDVAVAGTVDEFAKTDHELWLVDPLDGTVNFAHGVPHFCVSIACWRGGTPVAGAIVDPMVGELFSFEWDDPAGATTRSAWHDGVRVKLDPRTIAREAMVYVGGEDNHRLRPAIGAFRAWRRLGSAALALSWVGVGRCGAYLQPGQLNAWDWGAGAPFVLAAGGTIVLPDGGDWVSHPSSNAGIVAGSVDIVAEVAPIVADCLAGT